MASWIQAGGQLRAELPNAKAVSLGVLEWFGELGLFCGRLVKALFTRRFEWREFIRQCDAIGAQSLPLVALAGAATGAVIALQTRDSLIRFGAKTFLPAVIVYSLIKESGPVITGMVVSGRVGAGIGAELGSMKVSEQVDAMEASAVDPLRYLAVTRVLACITMLPLLTVAADFCGVVMGWVAVTLFDEMSLRLFFERGFKAMFFSDFIPATLKTAVFGLIIGVVSCFQGMRASGGGEGVGRAATSSVVISSLFVILADVIMVRLILTLFPVR